MRPSNSILVESAGPTVGVTEDDIASDNDMDELMIKEDQEDTHNVHSLESNAVLMEGSKEDLEAQHTEVRETLLCKFDKQVQNC